MGKASCDVPQEEIARRAYELWESRGRPAGDGTEDWDAAVAELTAQRRRNGDGGLLSWLLGRRRTITGGDN